MHCKYIPFGMFPTWCNFTQLIYFWKTALHVSGCIFTHHQEHTQLYLQYLVLVKHLPLPWMSWIWKPAPTHPQERQVAVTVWQVPDSINTVVCAPDDGWWYHPKHVERISEINKLCKVTSFWKYVKNNFEDIIIKLKFNVKSLHFVCSYYIIISQCPIHKTWSVVTCRLVDVDRSFGGK